MPYPYQPPLYGSLGLLPLRHVRDPDTGEGLWQRYDSLAGEWVDDAELAQSVLLFGVVPQDRGPDGDFEQLTKSELDDLVDRLDDARRAS